jgi:hypothetical protein
MANDVQQSAGDVRIEEVILTTVTGEQVDLSNFMLQIIIQESIYSPCIFGEIIMSDAINLLSDGPIIGKDTITLKIRTPELPDKKEACIQKTFSIYAVTDRKLNTDREQFYSIAFISQPGINDNITRLTQKFSGSTDDIAEKIFSDYIALEGNTMVMPDRPHSTNNFEFVANHWSPFQCMNYLAKNSIGTQYRMPNVMFFESNKRFYYGSITGIIQEQLKRKTLYDEYNYVPELDTNPNTKPKDRTSGYTYTSPTISNKMRVVEKIYYPTHFDQLKNQDSGYYGNTTFAYDFANKDIYHIQFDYTSRHTQRLEQRSNLIKDTFTSFNHIGNTAPMPVDPISDPLSNITFKAGASGLFGLNDAFDVKQVTSTCFRKTALAELEAVKYEITVPGKTDVEVGRLIRFNYPKVGDKARTVSTDDELYDSLISGIYIITGIRHDIDITGHKMILEITRDSFGANN